MMTTLPLKPICRPEAQRYMGLRDNVPDAVLQEKIDRCEQQLLKTAIPRFLWKVLPLTRNADGTFWAGDLRLQGNDIAAHLNGCTEVILLAATLSIQTDLLIAQAQQRDMTDALVVDALASAGIEQICSRAEERIHERIPERYMTWRFSPGYGDLPLEMQGDLLRQLDAERKIGLTVTETNLLLPGKSVTALIGLSPEPLPKGKHGCAVCNLRSRCQYRMKGVHCGYAD